MSKSEARRAIVTASLGERSSPSDARCASTRAGVAACFGKCSRSTAKVSSWLVSSHWASVLASVSGAPTRAYARTISASSHSRGAPLPVGTDASSARSPSSSG